jgi:hypothetical protein
MVRVEVCCIKGCKASLIYKYTRRAPDAVYGDVAGILIAWSNRWEVGMSCLVLWALISPQSSICRASPLFHVLSFRSRPRIILLPSSVQVCMRCSRSSRKAFRGSRGSLLSVTYFSFGRRLCLPCCLYLGLGGTL